MISLGVLFIFGVGIFGGMMGGWLFQRIRIPQVVGYLIIGILIGQTGLKLVSQGDVEKLQAFNLFALGIIGFQVGGELLVSTFKKYAGQFMAILFGEGLSAFVLVGIFSTAVMYYALHDIRAALAAGVVFAAIASATDPASTISVLWEYRSRGVLTTALIAIVALDDALAMTLYGIGTSLSEIFANQTTSLSHHVSKVSIEIFGSLALGFVFALILTYILRWRHQTDRTLTFALGLILLVISIAAASGMDVILAAMMMGFALVNLAPKRSQDLFKLIRSFSVPIYVLFFVFVGARLSIGTMPIWMWVVVLVYVIARSAGKFVGTYVAARATGADAAVRKYMGYGLAAQGGVAIGLSIMASEHLSHIEIAKGLSLGDVVIGVVTSTTMIVQILGPPLVKLAIKLADESGRDVTEEDVISSMTVRDGMSTIPHRLLESASLRQAMTAFALYDEVAIPVVDAHDRLKGMLSLSDLKEVLADQESWEWLIVGDVTTPADDCVSPDLQLGEAIAKMQDLKVDRLPVVNGDDGTDLVGILSLPATHAKVAKEVLRRQVPATQAAV